MAATKAKSQIPHHLLVALGLSKDPGAMPLPGARPPMTGQMGAADAAEGLEEVREMVGSLMQQLEALFPDNPMVAQVQQMLEQILQTPAHMPSGPDLEEGGEPGA